MRIPVDKPVYLVERIADRISFTGWLEQRVSYCNGTSLYDADDEGERPSGKQRQFSAKRSAQEDNTSLASKGSNFTGFQWNYRNHKHAGSKDVKNVCVDSGNDKSDEDDEPPQPLIYKSWGKDISFESTETRQKGHANQKQANNAHAKETDENSANNDASEEDMPPKFLVLKRSTHTENMRDSKPPEMTHKKHKWSQGTRQPTSSGAAPHKGEVTSMKVKQKKREHRIKRFENVFSGSSQSDREETCAQKLTVKQGSGLAEHKKKSTKVEDEEEQTESKSKRRKLLTADDDDEAEESETNAFQMKEALEKSLVPSSKAKLLNKGLIERVHKGSVKGLESVKRVHFVDKHDSKNDETDALGFHSRGLKAKSKLDEETGNATNEVPREEVKKDDSHKIPKLKKELKCVPSGKATAKAHTSKDSIIMEAKSEADMGKTVKEERSSIKSGTIEHQRIVLDKDCFVGEEMSSGVTEGGVMIEGQGAEIKGDDQPSVGWVQCDDCHKWRCIPIGLIENIEKTNCHWSCQENPNKEFADCSIPQEKSNADINAELNISDVSICEDGDNKDPPVDSKISSDPQKQSWPGTTWTHIKQNIYQHRQRKMLSIDEVMVCECMPPVDGNDGCRNNCHNRMVNVECMPRLCPCGDLCSNQQFQKRSYAKVGWFRCGKKGFGLQVLEDVPKGAFIVEYVGEVLDMASYEARQKEYTARGQRHFYFMSLNSNEVIDACVKGNLGRFINHSCDPNCVVEKWMVNGEVCIGLFAICCIKKGEEITFDYNLVRVPGVAAKRCLCGSANCQGYISGDHRSVVESDFDEDDPEPIMIEGSSEEVLGMEVKLTFHKNIFGKGEVQAPGLQSAKRKWMLADSSMKDGAGSKRVKTDGVSRKLNPADTKKPSIEPSGDCMDGVEEILNKMLDEKGGICRRQLTPKEAATQYLKLLMQTAASGDEASRSIRGLSMVLDALLKTVSLAILMGIVERNGLQLFHNLIKQFRKNYKMTPILRKLLKVLCFLCGKNILTREQINAEPVHYRGQSVRDTIFHLCRHADSEVQRIANYFKDKWLLQSSNVPSNDQKDFSSNKAIENRDKFSSDKLFRNQKEASFNKSFKNCNLSSDKLFKDRDNISFMDNTNLEKDLTSVDNINRHKDFPSVDNTRYPKDVLYKDSASCHKDFSSNKPFIGHRKFPPTVDTKWNSKPIHKKFRNHNSINSIPSGDDGSGHKQPVPMRRDEVITKPKKPSRWDQPSQQMQDTTEQGFPPSFCTSGQARIAVPYNSVHSDGDNLMACKSHEQHFDPATSQANDSRQLRLASGRKQQQTEVPHGEEQVRGITRNGARPTHISDESPKRHSGHAASQGTFFQLPVSVKAECSAANPSAAIPAASVPSAFDSHQPSPRPPVQQAVPLQFPAFDSQKAQFPAVVSGIPMGQPMPDSSTISYMPQNLSVCVGVPVTHMQGAHASGQPNTSSFTPMHGFSCNMREGPVMMSMPVESMAKGTVLPTEMHEVTCGIPTSEFTEQRHGTVSSSQFSQMVFGGVSASQFSQKMHRVLESASHLQSHTTGQLWDAYAVDDARYGRMSSGWGKRWAEDSRPRVPEEGDPEPPVPGL